LENTKDQNAEITLLFEDARDKLDKADKEAGKKKKEIVVELAKNLEGKIPTDTICMKIVERLDGIVSDSLIRDCLCEKYKQEYRRRNAKKQKKKHNKEITLAPLPVLNEEEDEEKEIENKEVVMIDVDGRTIIQRKEDTDPPNTIDISNTATDKTFVKSSYQSQQEQKSNKQDDPELMEDSDLEEYVVENPYQIEDNENSSHLINSDKIVSTISENKNKIDTTNEFLSFEFSMRYMDVQRHMAALFQKSGINERVWINGKIDRKTGIVIDPNLGRLGQQQQDKV